MVPVHPPRVHVVWALLLWLPLWAAPRSMHFGRGAFTLWGPRGHPITMAYPMGCSSLRYRCIRPGGGFVGAPTPVAARMVGPSSLDGRGEVALSRPRGPPYSDGGSIRNTHT